MSEQEKKIKKTDKNNNAYEGILAYIAEIFNKAKKVASDTFASSYVNVNFNEKYPNGLFTISDIVNAFVKNRDKDNSNDMILKLSLTVEGEKNKKPVETLATVTIKP